MAELTHPLGREAEQARDADELRQRLCLQLLQLRQLARLDELAQPLLDPGPDPGKLAHAPGADERGDVGRRRADQLRGAAIRADGVVARAVQVEQSGEGIQPFGEVRVRHDLESIPDAAHRRPFPRRVGEAAPGHVGRDPGDARARDARRRPHRVRRNRAHAARLERRGRARARGGARRRAGSTIRAAARVPRWLRRSST